RVRHGYITRLDDAVLQCDWIGPLVEDAVIEVELGGRRNGERRPDSRRDAELSLRVLYGPARGFIEQLAPRYPPFVGIQRARQAVIYFAIYGAEVRIERQTHVIAMGHRVEVFRSEADRRDHALVFQFVLGV